MEKEKKDKHFIQKPIYEGGLKAMKQFITENLKYPKAALENKIEGTVSLRYTINHKGKVIKVKIISGIGSGCDKEARRLVKKLVFSKSKNRGRRMIFHKTLQIHFRLPKEKPTKVVEPPSDTPNPAKMDTNITYNYVVRSSETNTESPKSKSSGGYSFTIEY